MNENKKAYIGELIQSFEKAADSGKVFTINSFNDKNYISEHSKQRIMQMAKVNYGETIKEIDKKLEQSEDAYKECNPLGAEISIIEKFNKAIAVKYDILACLDKEPCCTSDYDSARSYFKYRHLLFNNEYTNPCCEIDGNSIVAKFENQVTIE